MDAIFRFAEHVAGTGYDDLPEDAVRAAKIFILDTFGVGIAGSGGPWTDELVQVQAGFGEGAAARVWGRGDALPAPAAAMCNGYQIHNSEYDCVHEKAVIHPMTVALAAFMAAAERAAASTAARSSRLRCWRSTSPATWAWPRSRP